MGPSRIALMQRPRNGHRRASDEHRKESRDCSVEGGDGPDHSAAVFGSGTVAQRTEEGTAVADPRGSVWRGVGRRSAADPGESRTVGITLGGQIFDHLV